MSYGRLIYHNKSSTYFGARVVCPLVQAVTKRNVTLTPVVGVNGSYINDNLNYTNITQQLTFLWKDQLFTKTGSLGEWILEIG
ncbi:hypothetical protein LBGG_01961 [Lactobacillus gasseri MV-22]|nr:hypothetical protein LBGG_01961 [Lactobacillus gasseri MV-22]